MNQGFNANDIWQDLVSDWSYTMIGNSTREKYGYDNMEGIKDNHGIFS